MAEYHVVCPGVSSGKHEFEDETGGWGEGTCLHCGARDPSRPAPGGAEMTENRRSTERAIDALIDADGSVFPPDLSGYAAGYVAVYLREHWANCDPPLDAATQAGDVQDVINVLTRWKAQVAQGGGDD